MYKCVYSRYWCPGECVVHDRGSEFCNEVHDILLRVFNLDIKVTNQEALPDPNKERFQRISSAGHPMSNGQAESYHSISFVFELQNFLVKVYQGSQEENSTVHLGKL